MFIKNRKLILFQSLNFSNEIYDEISAHQWDVYIANDLQQASDLNNKHAFHVGLCLIDEKCNNNKLCMVGKPCLISKCTNTQQLTLLNRLFNSHSGINWIMGLPKECMSETVPNSTESKLIAEYCYDYVTLPVNIERLLFALGHAYGMNELSLPFQKPITDYPSCFGIIGNSTSMVALFRQLQKVANEDCSVLIQGETGTGKELIANAIHNHSSRSKNPFIAINCGTYTKELIRAELFGYEKGAFTGAHQRRIGRIEAAHGGTLFLDEIGDLPFEQQVNLLRFLEDRTIERIGGSEKIPVDVRIIAATHVNLNEAVQKIQFREDLYYRLCVLQIKTPPLRAREHDIELLAWYFFNKFSANQPYKAKGFHADSLFLLKNYDWPGNVRELMNCVRHALVMSENRLLTPVDLSLDRRVTDRVLKTLDEARASADRELIATCLHSTNFNMSRSAEILGISRVSLYRLADKYKLNSA